MGIPTLEVDNYEADDIIGTLSSGAPENVQVRIVTGDRDEFQLIKGNVQVLFTKRRSPISPSMMKSLRGRIPGLQPRQIIDLKGLMGDTSDNIPGVPGVGPKTALKLITEYRTVENVLDHAEEVKGKALKENSGTTGNRPFCPRTWPPSVSRCPSTDPEPMCSPGLRRKAGS